MANPTANIYPSATLSVSGFSLPLGFIFVHFISIIFLIHIYVYICLSTNTLLYLFPFILHKQASLQTDTWLYQNLYPSSFSRLYDLSQRNNSPPSVEIGSVCDIFRDQLIRNCTSSLMKCRPDNDAHGYKRWRGTSTCHFATSMSWRP